MLTIHSSLTLIEKGELPIILQTRIVTILGFLPIYKNIRETQANIAQSDPETQPPTVKKIGYSNNVEIKEPND